MDIKPFLAGMPLGPISGVASILMGAEMSQRRRAEEQAARDLDERRKIANNEIAQFQKTGRHGDLAANRDAYLQLGIHPDDLTRFIDTAGRYANAQIALDADTASKAGFQPYMGTPQQMQQAMAMTGQPGAPQGMTPQPPPMMAQQAQVALPPGAPGQVAASAELAPPINAPVSPGAVQTQEALGLRAGPQFGDFGMPPPPRFGAQPDTVSATRIERSPNPMQYGPGFDYQGKPTAQPAPATAPYNADAPQHITAEPIVMGQRKQFGPGTQPLALKFPAGIRPGKASVEGPLGTVPGKGEELQNSTAISQTMVDQAKGMGMSPDQLDAEYAKQIAKSGGNYPAFDETIRKTYKQEYFQKLAQDKTRALVAAGLPEPQAQQQGARLAADAMGGYYPEGAGQLVNYTPEERHRNVIGQATKQVMIQARAAMDASRPGEPATIQPGLFRKYVEEAFGTDGTPQEKEAALNDVTNMAMTTFRDKIGKLPGMTQAQAMIMSMQAAAGLAGYTPKEWQPMITANAQAFGITDPDIAQMVATGEIDLLQPGSLQAGITKKNALAYEGKIREKGMERQFAVTQTPEGVAATQQALTAQPSAPPAASPGAAPVGAGSPAAPQQTPGEIDRAIKTQQVAAETEAKEKVQKQYRLAPEKEIQDVRALDDMYTKGTRLLQLGEGDPSRGAAGLIEKYGNWPGTFFELVNSAKSATGSMDPELQEYVNTLSGLFNIEKKEFTGTATSLNERKDLVAWIPDKSTNVRYALQSVAQLVKNVTSDLKRNTEYIASNYPGTDLSSLKYNQIQQRRLARQQQQGTQPPLATAPPPPSTPQSTPLPPLGTQQSGTTGEGRPIISNADGSVSTERSITVTDPRLNGGRPTNIPSMYGGKEVSEDEAVRRIVAAGGKDPETGQPVQSFNSIPEAVEAAKKRSMELGQQYGNSLPPISQQVNKSKAAHPSEAVPKFGPGSTKAAAALVPNEIQQSLTPQDKGELHTAMKQYSRGQIDDKQLELAVAKVLMRAGTHSGKKNLEGQALNKAVAAWTEVLRRGGNKGTVARDDGGGPTAGRPF
jgi:hypothetical protein